MPKNRIFNGEKFGLYGTFSNKAKAQQQAKGLRALGFGARIVKTASGWAVYKSR